MRFTWRTELPQLTILGLMFALAAIAWSDAPNRIPTHYGLDGGPDDYGGKFAGLLLLPLIALGMYLMMILLPRLDPERANDEKFAGPYAVIRFSVIALIGVVHGPTLMWAWGHEVSIAVFLPLALGAMFLVIGSQLPRIRPNGFVGFRTPWTLTSPLAWERTHRAAAWLFMTAGVLLMAMSAIQRVWWMVVVFVYLLAGVLALTVYSYRLWRTDPERTK
jgi:uncharacterized membrane protein